MNRNYEYYTNFNWLQNPFTLKISPQLMVGYSSQTNTLLSHIFNSHKIALVIGHTGSGKTTMITWINDFINNSDKSFQSYYIPKPPRSKEDLISLFKFLFGFTIVDNFRFKNLSTQNLSKFLVNKTMKKKTVVLIDEAHESSIEVLEWLRTLTDIIPNLLIVFAGLPVFEEKMNTELPTLAMRITTKVNLESLNFVETESLVRKRIEDVGGKGLEPFTSDSMKRVFEISGGFPREVIKLCDKLIEQSSKENISTINETFVNQIFTSSKKTQKIIQSHEDTKILISEKQRTILEILDKKTKLSPSEIVENLEQSSYKNKNNAIRSVNNILRRLMRDELIIRQKMGSRYVYSLSGKAKSIFADA